MQKRNATRIKLLGELGRSLPASSCRSSVLCTQAMRNHHASFPKAVRYHTMHNVARCFLLGLRTTSGRSLWVKPYLLQKPACLVTYWYALYEPRNLLCCSARLPQGPVHTVTACDRFRRRFSELTAHHFRIANAKRSAILNIGYVPAINCNLLERMYTRRTISEKFSSFVL